jgi:hypothetical protein
MMVHVNAKKNIMEQNANIIAMNIAKNAIVVLGYAKNVKVGFTPTE